MLNPDVGGQAPSDRRCDKSYSIGTFANSECDYGQAGRETLPGRGGVYKRYRLQVAVISQHVLAAGVVFTTASDLHDARFLCILTVLATVLTVFFTRTIARGVRALVFILVLSHLNYSPNRWLISTTSLIKS